MRNREQGIEAAEQREREQEIAAEPDKGLLADRDQAGIAREQIPALRERQHVEQEDQVLNQVAAGEDRKQHQRQQNDSGGNRGGARGAARGLDAECLRRLGCASSIDVPQSCARGNRPRGRSTSTTRKARWPARICHSGSMRAPMVWASPSTMPPASVPQKLPRPPMITASKA